MPYLHIIVLEIVAGAGAEEFTECAGIYWVFLWCASNESRVRKKDRNDTSTADNGGIQQNLKWK